ncbi:hypothetical protein ACTL6U_18975 [Rhodovibrionaceae bacterium A322]
MSEILDETTIGLAEEAYSETFAEAKSRGESKLKSHMEGVTAAAMLVAAMAGLEDDAAKKVVLDTVLSNVDLRS